MKENINKKNIGNRKVLLEVRFKVKPTILDKFGALAEGISEMDKFGKFYWGIRRDEIHFLDNEDDDEANNEFVISPVKFTYSCKKMDSIDSTYQSFEHVYKKFCDIIGSISILQLRSKITGSYKVKSTNYSDIVSHFKETFPNQIFFDNYQVKDLVISLQHETGSYQLAPVKEDELFLEKEFPSSNLSKHNGMLIDVENYITNEVKEIKGLSVIKEIYSLSLAIEKDLFEKVAEF